MKKIQKFLTFGFYLANLILIILYLYPGSILGCFLYDAGCFYDDRFIQPYITKDFLISSNHFYMFVVLSIIGILAYKNTKKINFLIKYLFLLSIILEFCHMFIPNRNFEIADLFGNIIGVAVVVIIYKTKKEYE